jgi:CheY-like chemotaxis protein
MCTIVSRIFEETGNISVYPAGSGEEALEWSSCHHADVIVSEYDLPGINGAELLGALRLGGIVAPFIFFTQYFTEPLKHKARFPAVFRYIIREGKDKKQILKLLRIIYWMAGNDNGFRQEIKGQP